MTPLEELMEKIYADPTGATASYTIKTILESDDKERAYRICDALLRSVRLDRITDAALHALIMGTFPHKDRIPYHDVFASLG